MPIESVICPDNGVTPTVTQLAKAAALQTALAASKLLLFQAGMVTLTPNTTAADLDAAEATYDGYTSGGVTIATWGSPYIDPTGLSVLISAPSKQFDYVDGSGHVSNSIGGAYVKDSTGALQGACLFDAPVSMAANDDACVVLFSIRVV